VLEKALHFVVSVQVCSVVERGADGQEPVQIPGGGLDSVNSKSDASARRGTHQLMIGGQATDIESRYVLCVETAARVADEWLKKGRQSSLGTWERQ